MNNKTQPTPEQLAKWREDAELAFPKLLKKHYPHLSTAQQTKGATFKYINMATEGVWQSFEIGYIRAKQENEQKFEQIISYFKLNDAHTFWGSEAALRIKEILNDK